MYVRINRESKAKAFVHSIGTSGKIYIFWWTRVLRGQYFTPAPRRTSERVGQSMGHSAHGFYSQNRALRLQLVVAISVWMYLETCYSVAFFDILGILSTSCIPLLPFRNTICRSKSFHAEAALSVRHPQILAS